MSSVAAFLVQCPLDRCFTLLDHEARDLPGHWCANGRLAERALIVPQRGRGLVDLVARCLRRGTCDVECRSQLLELLVGDQQRVALLDGRRSVVVVLRLVRISRRLEGLGIGGGESGPGPLHGGLIGRRIDLQQQLTLVDVLTLLHRQRDDAAGNVRTHVDLGMRLYLAARRDRRHEISSTDRLNPDGDTLGAARRGDRHSGDQDDDRDGGENGPFGAWRHTRSLYRAGIVGASSRGR